MKQLLFLLAMMCCYLYSFGQSFNELLEAARRGDVNAQAQLGDCYSFGEKNVAIDQAEAVKWYRKAAEQGDAQCQYNVGIAYAFGEGVSKNSNEAVKWLRKAAEQEWPTACLSLGAYYMGELDGPEDYVEAVKWFRKGADLGEGNCQSWLGDIYEEGQGVTKDHSKAVELWCKSAEKGVSSGLKKCQQWADKGDAKAQNTLGKCYYDGTGVTQDYSEAVKWFLKSAQQGNTDSQNSLGYCYRNGLGVAQNYSEAVKWFLKSAQQGNADSQLQLGYKYKNGEGVPVDNVESFRWFLKAAEQGNISGMSNVGDCYLIGRGVQANASEAIKWLTRAASTPDATSALFLAVAYLGEHCVKENIAQFILWCYIALEYEKDEDTWEKYQNYVFSGSSGLSKLVFCDKEYKLSNGFNEKLGLIGKWKGVISSDGENLDHYIEFNSNGTFSEKFIQKVEEEDLTITFCTTCSGTYAKNNTGGMKKTTNDSTWQLTADLDFKSGVSEAMKDRYRQATNAALANSSTTNQILEPLLTYSILFTNVDEIAYNQEALIFINEPKGSRSAKQFGRVKNIP